MRDLLYRPYRVLAIACAAAALLVGSSYGWVQVNKIAKRRVHALVSKLSTKLGVPVEIGQWRIGFASAHFEDIVIGHDAAAVISEVTADVNLSPFHGKVGDLTSITVHRVRVKIPDRAKGHLVPSLTSAPGHVGESDLAPEKLIDRLFEAVPVRRKLQIKSGGFTLVDEDGKGRLMVRGLSVLVDKKKRQVLFKARKVKARGGFEEKDLQGRLALVGRKDDYAFHFQAGLNPINWIVKGRVRADLSHASLRYDMKTLPAVVERQIAAYFPEGISLAGKGRLTVDRQTDGSYRYKGRLRTRDLTFSLPVVSTKVIGPAGFTLAGHGFFVPGDRRLVVGSAVVSLPFRSRKGRVRLSLTGQATLPPEGGSIEDLRVEGRAALRPTPCQSILDAAPQGFAPALEGFKVEGEARAAVSFSLDGRHPGDFRYDLKEAAFPCKVVSTPFEFSSRYLKGPFSLEREVGKDGQPIEISVSPMSPGFTPYDSISRALPAALITSEDAGFWQHHGIDGSAIEQALRRNLSEGRIEVGGSTITMQTVKNLFLTHDRTISRKVQELFLAWHLENILDKERILEIYMNIAEFGPGIYGITQAAEHYFGKHPFDLDPKESAYLANLLPAPKHRYRHFCNGFLGQEYRSLVQGLLRRMRSFGRLDSARFGKALNSPLVFNEESRRRSEACRNLMELGADAS